MPKGGGHSVIVQREYAHQPWGLRLVGGCDLNKPIVVVRVASGSPAERTLKAGDVILQIGEYDARDLRHQDALTLFHNAQHNIKLVIHREGGTVPPPPKEFFPLPQSAVEAAASAPHHMNNSPNMDPHSGAVSPFPTQYAPLSPELLEITQQPYRTTPLVLPGAKARREFHPNESYLRHHPNPKFREAPPHPLLNHELAMKHKVADTVLQKVEQETGGNKQISHKQFNSPMGLYSEQNIMDTISSQAGSSTSSMPGCGGRSWTSRPSPRKTVQYDPSKSETYKALQDQEIGPNVHEVNPMTSKVFTPVKTTPPPNIKAAQPHPVPGPHVNSVGHPEEIQQSNTFKRLMNMVQAEGVY